MYEAYEPDDPYATFRFRDMGTLTRRFRGANWRVTTGMSSGATHEVQIYRPDPRKPGGRILMAVVRVPYAAVDAAHAADKDPTAEGNQR